jgi:hypothetical protein
MEKCDQDTITDSAFQHLKGIQMLEMSGCNQDGISDSAFLHLEGIRGISMDEGREWGQNARRLIDAIRSRGS